MEKKNMFKPSIKNKLIDIDYEDKNVKIAHYYNKKDHHGFPMHNDLLYVYTFDEYYEDWKVHAILEYACHGEFVYGWWYGSHCFKDVAYDRNRELINPYEEIAKYWAEKMFLPPREFVSKKDKERMEMDSLINSHICEMSEGMLSLSHTGA